MNTPVENDPTLANGAPNTPAKEASPKRPTDEEDDGPQPGNELPRDAAASDDEDGPQPGNERFPQPRTAAASKEGEGKRKRRRRKKKDGTERPTGEQGAEAAGKPGKRRERERPRPERERPIFTVGDVTFGRILEMTEEAIFVDLSGKGTAIFDRRELDLPDWIPGQDDADAKEEARADAEALLIEQSLKKKDAAAQEPPPDGAEAQVVTADAPAPPPAQPASEAEGAGASGPQGEVPAAQATEGEAKEAKEGGDAHVQIPPVVLEEGAHFVGIVSSDGGRGGLVVLTRHPKRVARARLKVVTAMRDGVQVLGLVTGVIKGGVEVDVDGLRAFAPASHVDLRLGADLTGLVGQRLPFTVSEYGKRGRDVVVSRKAMLAEEAKARREEALARIEVGSVLEGVVRSVVPFGAFVDIGGVEGLVPLSEMSHNRSEGPHDVFTVGEKVTVKYTKLDEKGKLWLSRKAVIPDPWAEVRTRYAPGTKHQGKVVRIQPFGVFVELESGVDGLLHAADILPTSTLKRPENPTESYKMSDPLEVVIAHVDPISHRIGLHLPLDGDAASEPSQRVQQYRAVKVKVVAIESGGLLVRILGVTGRNARGFITSAATGTPRGTELRKVFPVGKELEAKIMEIDPKRGDVKLSAKALSDEQERSAYQQYRQKVSRDSKFTFGDLLKKSQTK